MPIATTESPLDSLEHHAAIRKSGWGGKILTAYRPDPAVDPEFEGFRDNLKALAERYLDRPGGYLRVIKTSKVQIGDQTEQAILGFVEGKKVQ